MSRCIIMSHMANGHDESEAQAEGRAAGALDDPSELVARLRARLAEYADEPRGLAALGARARAAAARLHRRVAPNRGGRVAPNRGVRVAPNRRRRIEWLVGVVACA